MTCCIAAGPSAGRSASARPGFSLVELTIALLLLSMGLVALAGSAALAQLSFAEAAAIERAASATAAVIDSLVRETAIGSGSTADGPVQVEWTVRGEGSVERIDVVTTVEHAGVAREFQFQAARPAGQAIP